MRFSDYGYVAEVEQVQDLVAKLPQSVVDGILEAAKEHRFLRLWITLDEGRLEVEIGDARLTVQGIVKPDGEAVLTRAEAVPY